MMDCDTTGVAGPGAGEVQAGGQRADQDREQPVPQALVKLGCAGTDERNRFTLTRRGLWKARAAQGGHTGVRCSLSRGGRSISWTGHVKMMAAARTVLSGAISKTINMPEESTIEDIMNAYIESWKVGLKAVAIYRDNSKRSQPLNAGGNKKDEKQPETAAVAEPMQRELFGRQQREKMPVERASVTHKFSVGGHEGYITVGMYEGGRPGEVFIRWRRKARRFPA
jgi:ribonucleoside-diphosphate reductase alpha chain